MKIITKCEHIIIGNMLNLEKDIWDYEENLALLTHVHFSISQNVYNVAISEQCYKHWRRINYSTTDFAQALKWYLEAFQLIELEV